jgi:tetratricopeptide (TPR) repeat protein
LGILHAIKIIRRDQFGETRPFERELEGIRRYEPISRGYPNLVAILHVGGLEDSFYYVMELADSLGGTVYLPHTLRAELKQHRSLPVERVVEIGHALAGALAHLHSHQLVHRDVKPSNVIFVGGSPKLADIGLITTIDEARSFVGTEGYIPPEGPGTPSADCFSLGKVLYELSTGRDRTAWPEPAADLMTRPDRERLLELNAVIHRACAPDPRERYPSAATMRDEFALLIRWKSVKAERRRAQRWKTAKIAAVAAGAVAILTLSGRLMLREFAGGAARGPTAPPLDEWRRSTNAEANALYANALLLMRADDQNRMGEAYTNFVQATQLDSTFAAPCVALFEMQIREQFPGMPGNKLARMRELADKLKALAPHQAATENAQSFVQWADGHYFEALRCSQRAITANPAYELAHTHYGFILTLMGRVDEGAAELRRAEAIAPSKAVIQNLLGHQYFARRRYAEALEQYRKSLRFQKDFQVGHFWIGRCYQAMAQYEQAMDELENNDIISGDDPGEVAVRYSALRQAFKARGATGYWNERLRQAQSSAQPSYYSIATAHARLSHTDEALSNLDKSLALRQEDGDSFLHEIDNLIVDEFWDDLRRDPRFIRIVDQLGFSRFP